MPTIKIGALGPGSRASDRADGAPGGYALTPKLLDRDAIAALQSRHALVVEQCRPMCDSGGAGRFRGGLGLEFIVRASAEIELGVTITAADATIAGAASGLDGVHPSCWQLRDGMIRFYLPSSGAFTAELRRDDQLVIRTAGGGGHGLSLERAPQDVARDVHNEWVSPQSALFHYGVTVDAQTRELDVAATLRHRAMLLQAMRLPAEARDPLVTAITEDAMSRNHPDRAMMLCMTPGCCMPRIPFLSRSV